MSANKLWTPEQAEHVLEELAASIEAAKPAELAEDLSASGHDLNEIASSMKTAALSGIKQFQQRRLHQARQRYQQNSSRIGHRSQGLAASSDGRRTQFFALLKANPSLKSAVTLQHRDLSELTDEDIESALEELDLLGALEDHNDGKS
jgi:hypothetical protein